MSKHQRQRGSHSFSKNFFIEKYSTHVVAKVRGTNISVLVEMRQSEKDRSYLSESYGATCEPDSIWATEYTRICKVAEQRARELFKNLSGKKKQ